MTRTYAAHARPLWRRLLLTRESAIIAVLLVVVAYSIQRVPAFSGPLTLPYLVLDTAPILLIAMPMTLVIVTGEIDLSVASVVGLSSVTVGVLHEAGFSIPVAGLAALAVGVLCGLLNGFLVAYVGLPSLAVTIGTLALYRGIAVGLLGTKAVTDFPEKWTDLAKQRVVDGSSEVILDVPKYDFNWQTYYLFAKPLEIPAGARIVARAWYDNSAENENNPDPAATVHWGDQTWEEMQYTGILYSVNSRRLRPEGK